MRCGPAFILGAFSSGDAFQIVARGVDFDDAAPLMASRVPSSEQEQALIAHVEAALGRELPLREGPYALELREVPEEECKALGGQRGPVLCDGRLVSAYLHFDGLDRQGRPWSVEQPVGMCLRRERDLERATAIVEVFARVTRRAMRDAQDARFAPRPWLALKHLSNAMLTLLETPGRRTRTAAQMEAVLRTSPELRPFLVPPAAAFDAATTALDGWLAAHPTLVRTPLIELSHVAKVRRYPAVPLSPQGVEARRFGLYATLRLTVYDGAEVLDIREQQVRLVPASAFSNLPRVIACLDAWVAVLPRALEEALPTGEEAQGLPQWRREPDRCMPHDLFDDTVLELTRSCTTDDFAVQFAGRWRLGVPLAGSP